MKKLTEPVLRSRASASQTLRALLVVLVAAVFALVVPGCKAVPPLPLVMQVEARRVAADLRLNFSRAADASNRAVMADTDEASTTFATEAEQSKLGVRTGADALAPLLQRLDYAEESRALFEFRKHLDDYDALDRKVLGLAVENTNLKAQRLSYGPARDAANEFRTALDAVSKATPPKMRCRVESLAASAVIAVRELQVLHAPHIAELTDEAMSRIEKEMDALLATAREALGKLSDVVEPGSQATLHEAALALERFSTIHAQIIPLSRRNSNLYSLKLSLGEGRALSGACDADLRAITDALGKRELTTATR